MDHPATGRPHDRAWPKRIPHAIPALQTTLWDNLETSARRYPDKSAIVFFGREISYAELKSLAERLAGWLSHDAGVQHGDRVVLMMQNSPQFVIAFYAIMRADAVVVLIHQGGRTKLGSDPSSCADFAGDIQPIIARLNPGVDVIVSGHTHWAYVCDYAAIDPARPILLTSAGVYGELVTDITLRIDPKSKQVVGKRATNLIVQSAPYTSSKGAVANTALVPQFQPRADVRDYVARYVDAAKLFAERPVGKLTGPATRRTADDVDLGGSLGALIADSQLAATRGAGAQIAFMNPFGIRAPLVPAPSGEVTFAMIYAVQPFGNDLITQTLTGAELATTLELGFADSGPQQFLSPSPGFAYVVDRAAPPGWGPGKRLVSMTLNGKPIDPTANYRVTFNGFLANGGDGFDVLASKRDAVVGVSDLEALEAWLKSASPRPVPTAPRVTEARR